MICRESITFKEFTQEQKFFRKAQGKGKIGKDKNQKLMN